MHQGHLGGQQWHEENVALILEHAEDLEDALAVRMALGARPATVMSEVARRALPAVLGGVAIGVLGSALVGGALRGLLYHAQGFDLVVLVPVVLAMLVTAALALLVPARRAASVNPATALRSE